MIVVVDVVTQLPKRPVMMRSPNIAAARGCYIFSLKFVHIKVGYLYPQKPYRESVRLAKGYRRGCLPSVLGHHIEVD